MLSLTPILSGCGDRLPALGGDAVVQEYCLTHERPIVPAPEVLALMTRAEKEQLRNDLLYWDANCV